MRGRAMWVAAESLMAPACTDRPGCLPPQAQIVIVPRASHPSALHQNRVPAATHMGIRNRFSAGMASSGTRTSPEPADPRRWART